MRILSDSKKLYVIAEIGVNHEGSLEKAIQLVHQAAEAGADFVKFQSYTPERYASANDPSRLERVRKFALSLSDFKQLKTVSDQVGVQMLSTPVTEDWVEDLASLCSMLKIASGDITFKPVIERSAKTGRPVILSTGGATTDEIDQAVEWVASCLGQDKLEEKLILLHCVASYPVPIEEANILSIPFLKERYGLTVGYSNHVIGQNACLAAVALGAEIVEVHFTDCKHDREFRDHALSFDQQDLSTFINTAKEIKAALGVYEKRPQLCENDLLPLIRKGLIAAHDLKEGHIISESDLMYARPATEFGSLDIAKLVGKKLKKGINKGFLIEREAV